jgi:hypothetical protein
MMLVAIVLSRSLVVQGPEQVCEKNVSLVSYTVVIALTIEAPWEALSEIWRRLPLRQNTSMAGPLGVLLLGPVAATIEVEKTSTVGPLGLLLKIRERPPSMLKKCQQWAHGRWCWRFESAHHQR